MTDRLTLDVWRAEFCILAAKLGLDVSACTEANGALIWLNPYTSELYYVYKIGREAERGANGKASLSFIAVPVVSSMDWQSINAVARSDG